MASEDQPHLVQALYSFKGRNNDELCFKKGDIITVTQTEEGGWWEGTFGETTAWFPSNYVKEYKPNSDSLSLSKSHSTDWAAKQKAYRSFVLKDLIESERAHVSELQGLYHNFLLPIEKAEIMKKSEYDQLVGNLSEVLEVHTSLLDSLREAATQASSEQRVGRVFLTAAPHLKHILMAYCAAHPRAVLVLERYKQELSALMEANGAVSPGLLVLTAGLSKPFRRLDKYAGMLQEMERHVEESHPDRGDTQRSVAVYKDIASSCSMMRRQKEMEVEVVSGGVRGWEGSEELSALGDIVHMGSVAVGPEHRDRYLVLFPTTLLVLSVSHRMSAFIYEGKLPLTGINVNKLEETENCKNSFEIVGPMIERIVAVCQTKEDQQTWIDLLRQQIRAVRGGGGGGVPTSPKPLLATSPTTATTNLVSCKQKIRQSDTKRATTQGSVKYENRLAGTKKLGNCGAGLNNQLSKCESGLVAENNLLKCESGFHPDMRLAATSSSTRLLSPYARLAAYFARLVRRGVLTRKIVRRLLYRQFAVEGLVDTSMVRRRRSHRTECVIYPQKAVRTWVQESDDEEDEEGEEEGEEEEEEEGSVESSGFQYLKGGVYRSTLTVMKVGVPDLSRMDSRTAISNHLTVDDHTLSSSAAYQQRQSMPSPTLRRPLPPVHSASLDLPPPPVREIVTPTSVSTCSCPPSHRSSDSGLADVTTHHVETPCRCGRNHNNSGDDLIILEKTTCVCQSGNLVKYDGCSCRNVNESEIRLKCNYDGGIDQVTTSVDCPYGDLNKNHEFEEDMRLKCSFEDSDCPYSDLNKNHECEEDIRLKYGYEDEATNVECTYSDVNRNQFTCYMSKRYSRDDVLNEVVSNFDSNCSDLNEKCRCPQNDTECSQEDDLDSRNLVENCYQDGVTSKVSTREKVQIIGNKLAGKVKCTTQGHVSDENVVYDDVATRKWSLQDDVTASERRDNDVINNDFKESDNFYDVIKTQLPQDDVITIGNNVMNLDSGGINTFDDVRPAVRTCCSDDDKQELPLTYRSGMYAHWWLKTHLPSADAASDDFATASHDSVAVSDDCERRRRQRSHTDCGEQ